MSVSSYHWFFECFGCPELDSHGKDMSLQTSISLGVPDDALPFKNRCRSGVLEIRCVPIESRPLSVTKASSLQQKKILQRKRLNDQLCNLHAPQTMLSYNKVAIPFDDLTGQCLKHRSSSSNTCTSTSTTFNPRHSRCQWYCQGWSEIH